MKLNVNFTSPSQGQRLMEIGLPRDSVDCIGFVCNRAEGTWLKKGDIHRIVLLDRDTYTEVTKPDEHGGTFVDEPFPCWSVGRLIEIYENLMGIPFTRYNLKISLLDEVLERYWQNKKQLDFSKLED